MQIFTKIQTFFMIACFVSSVQANPRAVICHPVVDMSTGYFAVPNYSAASPNRSNDSFQRVHQGLYNELVDIVGEVDGRVKVFFKDIMYTAQPSSSTFWVERDKLQFISEIKNEEVLQAIPDENYAKKPTIALIYPYKNFSVGTRFVRAPDYDSDDFYGIIRAGSDYKDTVFEQVPRKNAVQEFRKTPLHARKLFIALMNGLVDRLELEKPGNVIAYVWGGSSFVDSYKDSDFYQKDNVWDRNPNNVPVYTGYDCSEFIMRMAKIAGINFPWKNSAIIRQRLAKLSCDDSLQDGDIIWISGHVMIVSNIKNSELIEARGYASGFGCVHKIKLVDMFENIVTYDDLLADYFASKPLTLKDRQGNFYKKFNDFAILRLIS